MTDLFPHYPSPPEELVGIAAQLISTAGDTEATISDVRGGVDRAVDAVDGDLTFPMSTAAAPVIRTGANVARTARFASGAVMFFAQAVQAYDRGIDRLNAQVHEGEFDAMSAGKAAKLQRLTAERAQLEADLDAAASRVAAMLERGPNAEAMRFLRNHGCVLPLDLLDSRVLRSAMAAMPPGTDPDAIRRWWDSLSLAQQVAVMAAHPEQLGNTDGLAAEIRDEANRLVLVHPEITPYGLRLTAPDLPALEVATPDPAAQTPVSLWSSRLDAVPAAAEADAWFSKALDRSVHLVHLDDPRKRPTSPATREREARTERIHDARRQEQAAAADKAQAAREQRQKRCSQMRDQLGQLNLGGPLYRLDERGADPTHRIEHQLARIAVGADHGACELGQHLRRVRRGGG